MPYTPDDPRRFEADFDEKVQLARIRIYQYSRECCEDLRKLIDAAGTDGVEHLEDFAKKVGLSVVQYNQTNDIGVSVDIEISDEEETERTPDGKLLSRRGQWLELKPSKVRDVFRKLREELRVAVADYLLPGTFQQLAGCLEAEGRYDEIEDLERRFETLRDQLIEGELPVPPTRSRFPSNGSI